MGWEYSDHSHKVSEYGGPAQYDKAIRADERLKTTDNVNKKWISGIIPAILLLTPLIAKGIRSMIDERRQKRRIIEEEAKRAEEKLIEVFENQDIESEDVSTEESPC